MAEESDESEEIDIFSKPVMPTNPKPLIYIIIALVILVLILIKFLANSHNETDACLRTLYELNKSVGPLWGVG